MHPLRHLLVVSISLFATMASWSAGINVPTPKGCAPGGCDKGEETGHCDPPSNESLEWSVNLGWARYVKPVELVSMSKIANLRNGNLTDIEDFYRTMFKQGALQRSQIKLEMSQPYINANTFHPSILYVEGEPEFATVKAPAANGFPEYISRILTDDAFTYVELLPSPQTGWRLRIWKRNVSPSSDINGLAAFLTKVPVTDVIYKRPDGTTGYNTLVYIQKETTGSSGSRVITRETVQQVTRNAGPPTSLVSKTFSGEGTLGPLLSEERLWFSGRAINQYGLVASAWNYTITREVDTASVNAAGTIGPLTRTRRSLEDYDDYSTESLRTYIVLPSTHPTFGALITHPLIELRQGVGYVLPYTLVRRHPFGGLPGMKRLKSLTEDYGVAGQTPQISTYTYFEDLTTPVTDAVFNTLLQGNPWNLDPVPDLTGSTIQGRMQSSNKADGSWTSTFHSNKPFSTVTVWTEYSGWMNFSASQLASARRTVTTTSGDRIDVEKFISGQKVASSTRVHVSAAGEIIAVATDLDGTIEHTTRTAYYPDLTGSSSAGRIKWIEKSDGTAAVYSYAPSGPDLVVKARTGVGSRTGVTAGTEVVTTYSFGKVPTAQVTKDIASNQITERWDTDLSYNGGFDPLGRPIKRIYNADVNDFDIREYACCGLEYSRERDGTSTNYSRDGLKRVYKVESRASANSPPVKTFTTVAGLTQESYRSVGTSDSLFLGATTRSMDGLTTTTTGPSQKSLLVADRPVTTAVRVHAAALGDTITTTYDDLSKSIASHYLDGQIKSQSGTAVPDVDYSYATVFILGGEVTRLGVTEKRTASGVTTFTQQDDLGRTVRTALKGAGSFPMSVTDYEYYPPTASPGSRGKLKSVTDSDLVKVSYGYNLEGEQTTTSRTIPLASGTATQVTSKIRSVEPNVTLHGVNLGVSFLETTSVSSTNTPAVTTLQAYAAINGLAGGSISFGRQTLAVGTRPDPSGVATQTTTHPDGTKTRATYQHGLLTSTSSLRTNNPVISSTSHTYDPLQRPLTTTDSRTGPTTYDLRNNTTGALIPDGLADVTESGLPLAMKAANGDITTYSYDKLGRLLTTDAPDTLDASGATLANITYTAYHPTGLVKATWGNQTYPTWHVYDEQNRLTQLHTWQTDPGLTLATILANPPSGSAVTTWIYGPATGRLDRKQYADTKGTDYTYTTAGRLQTREWSRLNTDNLKTKTSYGYTHGLLTSTDYNDATPDVLITYEPLGRQKSVSTSVAKSVFVYDPATLRLDTETIYYNLDTVAGYEFSRVLDRSNDSYGRSKGYELKDNTMIDAKANYDYDPLTGRLETVDDGGLSQYIYGDNNFTYTYVENSTSNLIDNVLGGMLRVYNTWEPNRDVLKLKENLSRTLVKNYSTFTYTTNAIGQRERVVANGENPGNANNTAFERTWGYDSRGQLTQENDTQNDVYDRGFAYDAIGNRTKSISANTNVTEPAAVSYTPNDLNQYSAINDPASALMTPLYDDDGNTKSSSIRPTGMPGASLQTAIYDWDAENRLVKITRPNLTVIASYQYDAFGRRIAKKDGDNYQSIWVYDGWNPIALYGSPTYLYENYLWGLDMSGSLQGAGGVGGLLAISYSDYNVCYPTYDGNGNVSEYIEPYPDPDFAFPYDFVAAHYEYDAFGNVTNSEGWSASNFPFRFSTKQQDDESGLLYYTYRYYDPLTGRWPSRDPIGERGGSNLYGFVTNDPIFSIDYLGLLQESPIRCCTPDVIADGKKELEKLYDAAVEAFKKRGIEPLGVGSRSCKNIASAVGLALSPIPKCWTCKNEQWAGRFLGDHQWITCVSTPLDDSKGEEIAFDYWGGYGSSVDPNTLRNQYFSRENPDQDLRLTGKNCNSKLGEPLNHDPFAEINKIPPTPPPLTPAIYPNLLNLPTQ